MPTPRRQLGHAQLIPKAGKSTTATMASYRLDRQFLFFFSNCASLGQGSQQLPLTNFPQSNCAIGPRVMFSLAGTMLAPELCEGGVESKGWAAPMRLELRP